ncbi:hypothetical protein BDY24DRAFT_411545 [Mrakia frigida]|uniref:uncharacterized protein n=1 Tax=Mrakia frigida TaxID=29902 RepID=UPI003FCC2155
MDLFLARLSQLENQVQSLGELPSIVARLSAENEAHRSSSSQHSSTVARLSSENESLRRTVEGQDRVIGELTIASPSDGFWIWESEKGGREEEGRRLWSSEKYKSLPLAVSRSAGPPTSLQSLPNELLDLIVSLLPTSDQLTLSRCSFMLLQIASRPIYGYRLKLSSKEAASFVSSRITHPSESSPRISSILMSKKLRLQIKGFRTSDLSSLLAISSHLPRLHLSTIVLQVRSSFPSPFSSWSPLLRLVDPHELIVNGRWASLTDTFASSTFRVSKDELACTSEWNRLSSFIGYGEGSIPMLEGDEQIFAISECLLRAKGEGRRPRFEVVTSLDGEQERDEVEEEEIASYLHQLLLTDSTRSATGAYLCVTLKKSAIVRG